MKKGRFPTDSFPRVSPSSLHRPICNDLSVLHPTSATNLRWKPPLPFKKELPRFSRASINFIRDNLPPLQYQLATSSFHPIFKATSFSPSNPSSIFHWRHPLHQLKGADPCSYQVGSHLSLFSVAISHLPWVLFSFPFFRDLVLSHLRFPPYSLMVFFLYLIFIIEASRVVSTCV